MQPIQEGLRALSAVQKFFPRAILAGGYLRDALNGRTPKDIDIFIPSTEMADVDVFERMLDATQSLGATEYIELGEIEHLWDVPGFDLPVQVISLRPGLDPIDRAKHHDFGICQVWHDGISLAYTPAYRLDAADQCFTLVHCEDDIEYSRSLRRWERLKDKYAGWKLVVPAEIRDPFAL